MYSLRDLQAQSLPASWEMAQCREPKTSLIPSLVIYYSLLKNHKPLAQMAKREFAEGLYQAYGTCELRNASTRYESIAYGSRDEPGKLRLVFVPSQLKKAL